MPHPRQSRKRSRRDSRILTPEDHLSLDKIMETVRNYKGLTRKKEIRLISSLLSQIKPEIIAARGEDGAVIALGDKKLIFATDGIMEDLANENPRWAGYCSILVNVNDIIAMGGKPLVAANVISAIDDEQLSEIVAGMTEACKKFHVEIVGGHLHPQASKNDVSVTMLGICENNKPILSSTARAGEKIVVLTDCNGKFTPGIPYSWDCTSMKKPQELSSKINSILSGFAHFSSAKDISNPGILGTLAMLLEASRVGAVVSINDIPIPSDVDLLQWLTAYQGLGFIGTVPEKRIEKLFNEISGTDLSFSVIGHITDDLLFTVELGVEKRVLFDLSKEKITGLF